MITLEEVAKLSSKKRQKLIEYGLKQPIIDWSVDKYTAIIPEKQDNIFAVKKAAALKPNNELLWATYFAIQIENVERVKKNPWIYGGTI
jgi:hypothetical protein